MILLSMIAAVLFQAERDGVEVKIAAEKSRVDPAESLFFRVELKAPKDSGIILPDLRSRVNGFSLAEDFVEEAQVTDDGRVLTAANWRLVPEPSAKHYRIRPFAVGPLVCGPVYFDPPSEREVVTGAMEVNPKKDFPDLSWRLAGLIAAVAAGLVVLIMMLITAIRFFARKIKEHRMSPIERAWVELERLIKKGLPGRGRYKDFYVELTMVVRRYIQRKYGIRAPHMTTEEFLQAASPSDELKRFLQSADMVKFAGVQATADMTDDAVDSARAYLKSDSGASEGGVR